MITTTGLTKRFGPILAVDRIDLDVREGDIYGFLGANGSYEGMFAVVLTVALLGFAADRCYGLLMGRVLRWRD